MWLYWAGLKGSHNIRMRHGVERRSLDGERRVQVDGKLGMLPRLFVGAPYRLGKLTFKGCGNGMVHVLMHGGQCEIGG